MMAYRHPNSKPPGREKSLTTSHFALVHEQLLDGELIVCTGLKAEAGVIMQDDMCIGIVDGIGVASSTG